MKKIRLPKKWSHWLEVIPFNPEPLEFWKSLKRLTLLWLLVTYRNCSSEGNVAEHLEHDRTFDSHLSAFEYVAESSPPLMVCSHLWEEQ